MLLNSGITGWYLPFRTEKNINVVRSKPNKIGGLQIKLQLQWESYKRGPEWRAWFGGSLSVNSFIATEPCNSSFLAGQIARVLKCILKNSLKLYKGQFFGIISQLVLRMGKGKDWPHLTKPVNASRAQKIEAVHQNRQQKNSHQNMGACDVHGLLNNETCYEVC